MSLSSKFSLYYVLFDNELDSQGFPLYSELNVTLWQWKVLKGHHGWKKTASFNSFVLVFLVLLQVHEWCICGIISGFCGQFLGDVTSLPGYSDHLASYSHLPITVTTSNADILHPRSLPAVLWDGLSACPPDFAHLYPRELFPCSSFTVAEPGLALETRKAYYHLWAVTNLLQQSKH